MFKSAKWRSQKNKIKAVFKLQFHATQVLQSGVDTLALSLVPVDVGKPSVRLQSTKVQDGSCRWENPVCEYVRFIQEAKTGKITEKFYHFVVSTGGSHSNGLLGEVSLNFADYAETTKPSSVSLPLRTSHNNAVLHVLIQKLPENVDQRKLEHCDDAKRKSQDKSLLTCLSTDDPDETNQSIAAEDASAKSITDAVGLNAVCRSSSGSEMTLSSSDSTSGLDTPIEISLRNSSIHQDTNGFRSLLSEHSELKGINLNASTSPIEEHQKLQWEWSAGPDHGLSTDSFHGGLIRDRSEKASDSQIEKLKAEISILVRQVDISELELQTLRKQIVKESKRAQDLSKEAVTLKEERDNHKSECERLRSFQKRKEETKARNNSQFVSGELRTLVEEIREELHCEKELSTNLRVQLQKTQESNAELMLAVRDLDEMLEQKNKEISNLSNKLESKENALELRNDVNGEKQKASEKLVREHCNVKETYLLEQKIIDLYNEIEIYRRDKDELQMQMEQLALDYEILKQQNHDIAYKLEQSQLQEQLSMQYEFSSPASPENDLEHRIMSLENELRTKSEEFSDSLATVKELEIHVKTLGEELDKQAQGFTADLESLILAKVEQEQRAIRAEEALRQTRSKNARTAERLQEEFRRFSMQMTSTLDTNEKVAMKAMTEAHELSAQKNQLEEMLREVQEELNSANTDYEVKLHEFSCQIDTKTHQIQDMLLEIGEKSKQLESKKNHEKEVHKSYSDEIEMLKAKVQRFEAEISCLTEQIDQNEKLKADLESMRQSVEEADESIHGNALWNELVVTMVLFKKETQKSAEELNKLKHTNDEKERTFKFLTSELENLRVESSNLKASLSEDEVEKEKLCKLVVQLKDELEKKDNAFANIERKFKDSNGHTVLYDGTKTSPKNKEVSIAQTLKEVSSLREKIKMLEDLIKLKETALDTSSSSILEKEKQLHKIEELESRIEDLSQSCPFQQSIEEQSITALNDDVNAKVASTPEFRSATTCSTTQNEDIMSLEIRNDGNSREPNGSMTKHRDNNYGDLMTELASLKEKNKEMESELQEMQERYSEISVKFAEVEGERQRLMMTVRTLKNARKS